MNKELKELISNENALIHIKEFFTIKRLNGVISSYTAASIYGLCEFNESEIDITFPKGSVPKGLYDSTGIKYNIFQREKTLYESDVVRVNFNSKEFRIYSLEKTIAEIAKEFVNDPSNDKAFQVLQKTYFKREFNVNKLHMLYDKFNILKQMRMLEMALENNISSKSVDKLHIKVRQFFKENIYYLMRFESKLG